MSLEIKIVNATINIFKEKVLNLLWMIWQIILESVNVPYMKI